MARLHVEFEARRRELLERREVRQAELRAGRPVGAMGYKFQFITLTGWHLNNVATFELASAHADVGMPAYVELQQREFALESQGYSAVKHEREVGVGYFDQVLNAITGGECATRSLTA